MVKGGEAAGGGAWRGGAGPGSRAAWQRRWRLDPKVGARSRLAWLGAGYFGKPWWWDREDEAVTPGAGRSHGALKHPQEVRRGRLARVPLSRPARAGAGEQQAGASGFSRSPCPRAGSGRRSGQESGRRAGRVGEWGRGRCPDFASSPSRGGKRAGQPPCLPRRAAAGPRPDPPGGRMPACLTLPVGPAEAAGWHCPRSLAPDWCFCVTHGSFICFCNS